MNASSFVPAKIFCAELEGITSRMIEVEVDMHAGLPSFVMVGLPEKAVSEAKERVSAAIKNCGLKAPNKENRKITVNLAPADTKKSGAQYDVAIAIGYLLASGQIASFDPTRKIFLGELALDGSVRPVAGVLNACLMALQNGIEEAYVPVQNMREVSHIHDIKIFPITHLHDLIFMLEGKVALGERDASPFVPERTPGVTDISEIRGQVAAKRVLSIAAAGGHNMLMSGPPGAGKTMLAQSLVSILPDMTFEEALEVTQVYSAAGMLMDLPFVSFRPFRSPHHSASLVSLVGGGTNPKPGEISLSHRGILFLDEIPEFHRDVLESLRQPLESGKIVVARSKHTLVFPAKFILIAACNPCPCGYYRDGEKECTCSAGDVHKYQKKLSGPLLDRIDLHIWVPRIKSEDLKKEIDKKESWVVKNRVDEARKKQRARFKKSGLSCFSNSELTSKQVSEYIPITREATVILDKMLDEALLSARGYFKAIKVAQTIADLDEKEIVDEACVQEAFSYRFRDANRS